MIFTSYYHTCDKCGANLDPGEKCDCEEITDINEIRHKDYIIGIDLSEGTDFSILVESAGKSSPIMRSKF